MKYKTFKAAIKAIKKQHKKNQKQEKLLSKAFGAYNIEEDYELMDSLSKVLAAEMKDKGDWIQYYLWEIDFGKKGEGCGRHENGVPFSLRNARELYDFLKQNK